MFAAITVDEPIEKIADDWDFFEDRIFPKFSGFKHAGNNILGIRRRTISLDGVIDPVKGNASERYEFGPDGPKPWHQQGLKLHVTAAGTPHHVVHNFGYWHINDKDELYLPLPGDPGFTLVLQGNPVGEETDRMAWYCEQCQTMIHEHVIESGRYGFLGIWKHERMAVTRYNSDVGLRTCPECGHVNKRAYCFHPRKDTPEEAEARKAW